MLSTRKNGRVSIRLEALEDRTLLSTGLKLPPAFIHGQSRHEGVGAGPDGAIAGYKLTNTAAYGLAGDLNFKFSDNYNFNSTYFHEHFQTSVQGSYATLDSFTLTGSYNLTKIKSYGIDANPNGPTLNNSLETGSAIFAVTTHGLVGIWSGTGTEALTSIHGNSQSLSGYYYTTISTPTHGLTLGAGEYLLATVVGGRPANSGLWYWDMTNIREGRATSTALFHLASYKGFESFSYSYPQTGYKYGPYTYRFSSPAFTVPASYETGLRSDFAFKVLGSASANVKATTQSPGLTDNGIIANGVLNANNGSGQMQAMKNEQQIGVAVAASQQQSALNLNVIGAAQQQALQHKNDGLSLQEAGL